MNPSSHPHYPLVVLTPAPFGGPSRGSHAALRLASRFCARHGLRLHALLPAGGPQLSRAEAEELVRAYCPGPGRVLDASNSPQRTRLLLASSDHVFSDEDWSPKERLRGAHWRVHEDALDLPTHVALHHRLNRASRDGLRFAIELTRLLGGSLTVDHAWVAPSGRPPQIRDLRAVEHSMYLFVEAELAASGASDASIRLHRDQLPANLDAHTPTARIVSRSLGSSYDVPAGGVLIIPPLARPPFVASSNRPDHRNRMSRDLVG